MGRSARTYSAATVEQVIKALEAAQPKPKKEAEITTKDAVITLKPAIKAMQQKGYSLNEILAVIRESGMDIGLTAIKSAIAKPKRRREDKNVDGNLVTKPTEPKTAKAPQALATKALGHERTSSLQDPDEK